MYYSMRQWLLVCKLLLYGYIFDINIVQKL
jgi:hypothetical protein